MRPATAFLAMILFASPVLAQWQSQGGYTFNNPTSALVGTMLNNRMWANMMKQSIARHQGASSTAATTTTAPRTAPHVASSATDFRPTLPRYTVADATADQQGHTPQEKAAYKRLFRFFVDSAENASGFHKNNVAWALAYLVLASLQVSTGNSITDAQSVAFAQELNDGMAASRALGRLGAADQQRLYEGCLVVGGLVIGSWAEAQKSGDPQKQAHVRQMARQILASFGA